MIGCRYDLPRETLDAQVKLAADLNARGVSPEDCGSELGPHPEGASRGGYVPVLIDADNADVRVFYNSTAEEWCGYDG